MANIDDKHYWVYVLWSPSARHFYIGATEDVEVRAAQHNAGISNWTARYRPWRVVYTQECDSYSAARQLENDLKRQKGGDGFYARTGLRRENYRTDTSEASGS